MTGEQYFAAASVVVSLIALGLSTVLLTRQNKQLEHERNALAILDAIGRLTDPAIVEAFAHLEGIEQRYPDDDAVRNRFDGSPEDRALVLVEGAGGLLVRYDEEGATLADLAHELGAPVLVVADPRLGTLNHTALTLESMAMRGVALAGVVLGSWPAGDHGDEAPDLAMRANLRDLETLAARPLAGALPAGAGRLDAPEFLLAARAGLGPTLGGAFDAARFRAQWGV